MKTSCLNERHHNPPPTHPWLCVLKDGPPSSLSDEVVREGSALHNVVHLVVLEGDREPDEALELTFALTQ